jgi:hypothetical protein
MRRPRFIASASFVLLGFTTCNRTPSSSSTVTHEVSKVVPGRAFSTVGVYTVDLKHDSRRPAVANDSAQRTVGP